ncbi:expressed unknown protein [Seminavis robusta]|uniref:Uncharacterized protein n=1 Tax=Seminavis robusta TaxID=568900 RepID=A0A9N8EMZ6_9STRA|nr:expressed unknown protein [Seminavis robusta]|eukprot:Sro1361_g266240.1 n/a (456) ;mRNA; r:22436-24038
MTTGFNHHNELDQLLRLMQKHKHQAGPLAVRATRGQTRYLADAYDFARTFVETVDEIQGIGTNAAVSEATRREPSQLVSSRQQQQQQQHQEYQHPSRQEYRQDREEQQNGRNIIVLDCDEEENRPRPDNQTSTGLEELSYSTSAVAAAPVATAPVAAASVATTAPVATGAPVAAAPVATTAHIAVATAPAATTAPVATGAPVDAAPVATTPHVDVAAAPAATTAPVATGAPVAATSVATTAPVATGAPIAAAPVATTAHIAVATAPAAINFPVAAAAGLVSPAAPRRATNRRGDNNRDNKPPAKRRRSAGDNPPIPYDAFLAGKENLIYSKGVTMQFINKNLDYLGLRSRLNKCGISSDQEKNICVLQFKQGWVDVPSPDSVTGELIIRCQRQRSGGHLRYYVGHFKCKHCDNTPLVYKDEQCRATLTFSFHRFDDVLQRKLDELAALPFSNQNV